jgi:hypothetical protein
VCVAIARYSTGGARRDLSGLLRRPIPPQVLGHHVPPEHVGLGLPPSHNGCPVVGDEDGGGTGEGVEVAHGYLLVGTGVEQGEDVADLEIGMVTVGRRRSA